MLFPPLKYTLPSFENVTIVYRQTMAGRAEMVRFADSLTQQATDTATSLDRDDQMLCIVARSLVDVESEGVSVGVPTVESDRAEWLRTTFPPKAIGESFGAMIVGKVDEAFEKKS